MKPTIINYGTILITAGWLLSNQGETQAGVVTADPSADSDNIILIDKDDTVVFTAQSSGNDDDVEINDSTFQNGGTPSFDPGGATATASVTFDSAALGNQNLCKI